MRHIIILAAAIAAIVAAAPSGADAAQGAKAGKSGRFCLTQQNVGPDTSCYATMAACNNAKTGNTDICTRKGARTTGAGARY